MSKILIIGEKPSIARKIVEGLSLKEHFNKTNGFWESESYIVSSCVGHLLSQQMPSEIDSKYKKWCFENLPFNFSYIPLKVTESTKDQFKIVKELFRREDIEEICNACDADREGELIFRNLVEFLRPKCKNLSRMWIESVATPEIMLKQFEARKNETEYEGLYNSAKARAYADYLLGLNSTQAMSIKYNKKLSIGRVITPTLRIITDLEKKILNFKSLPFYKVSCDTNCITALGYKSDMLEDNRFKTREEANALIKKVGLGEAIISALEKKEEKEACPKLFSLSDLQVECSKKYKYGAQEVLDACQSLYENHGLTTYPRTSENHISKELALTCGQIVDDLDDVFGTFTGEIKNKGYKINDSCIAKKEIASHEALTPTLKRVTKEMYEGLTIIERNVYNEIVWRFLANFYPNAVYSVINIELTRNNEVFVKKNKALKVPGFYEVYGIKPSEEAKISLKENDKVQITSFNITEGKTEPPKRLTEGSLIKIMMAPMKYVESKEDKDILSESGGLGTEATRAGIIENMKKYNFITLKRGSIYATESGMMLIDLIPSEIIKSVPLTASFEAKLKLIKDNKYTKEKFLEEIMSNVNDFVEQVKGSKEDTKFKETKEGEICKCPNCGSSVVEGKYGYQCSNWKNCKVQIFYNLAERLGGKKITKTQAKELLVEGQTKKELDLVSKAGKPYKAFLTYRYCPEGEYPNVTELKFNK